MRCTFLITSGPTREYLDPVRYLSNASTGAMGAALAAAAVRRGHRVIFVTGPAVVEPPTGVTVVRVTSARDMFAACRRHLATADIVIAAAAVADFRPAQRHRGKIKKEHAALILSLAKNPDILEYIGRHKAGRIVAGFALESSGRIAAARKKLNHKNLDLIAANAPAAVGSARSTVWLLTAGNSAPRRLSAAKTTIAEKIVDETLGLYQNRPAG